MAKVIYTKETTDKETGKVTTTSVVKSSKSVEPSYIKLYIQDISYLYDLPTAASDLLHELLGYVTYTTNEIVLNSELRKRICDNIGIKDQTFRNKLSDLVKKGVLQKTANNIFMLNPFLFGKGDWKSIKELRDKNIHLEIVYDSKTGERLVKGQIGK